MLCRILLHAESGSMPSNDNNRYKVVFSLNVVILSGRYIYIAKKKKSFEFPCINTNNIIIVSDMKSLQRL